MPSMDEFERIATFLPSLTEAEREDLQEWEQKYVTGDGARSSSDWPGWAAVFKRLQS